MSYHIVLTVADHEKNGFIYLARWTLESRAAAMEAARQVSEAISAEEEPDSRESAYNFVLDVEGPSGDWEQPENTRYLPMQLAMRLALDPVRRWLAERPEPDDVLNRIPVTMGQWTALS